MSDDPRHSKRSRFDDTEPRDRGHDDRKRSSRFDRRDRSPRRSRSRSPRPSKKQDSPPPRKVNTDAAAAAAAAAAKINAQIQARKGIQHVDVPPIRAASGLQGSNSPAGPSSSSTPTLNGEVYVADGDFIKDIEVNNLRNRYTLTKGSTQKMIKEATGADVTTRGAYYPDKSLATPAKPPLYLHVTSTTKEGLDQAVKMIDDLMEQDLPPLVDERRFKRRDDVERDEFGRRKWPEEKIPINLDPVHGFNLRAKVVGHGGQYVKHIQQETGCRVQIKGHGSGFVERDTGLESDEPMYLHVAGPDASQVERAKNLCLDLLDNVREEYELHKANPSRGRNYSRDQESYSNHGGHGGHNSHNGHGGHGGHNNEAAAPEEAPAQDYSAQYAQYYANGQDPYAAYGGYQNYVAYYNYWAQQQQQQPQAGQAGSAPPPPGQTDDAAPPPPPPSDQKFSSVPPPPGL